MNGKTWRIEKIAPRIYCPAPRRIYSERCNAAHRKIVHKSGVYSCEGPSRSGWVTKYKDGQQKEPSRRENRSGLGNSGYFTNVFRFKFSPDQGFGNVLRLQSLRRKFLIKLGSLLHAIVISPIRIAWSIRTGKGTWLCPMHWILTS